MRAHDGFRGLTLAFLVLMLAGCTGTHAGVSPATSSKPATPGLSLPDPSQLPPRSPSFIEADLVRQGNAFEATLPMSRVLQSNTDGVFLPNGDATSGAPNLSYAVYSFGVKDYNRELDIRPTWTDAPDAGHAWVAVANFAQNRWEWQTLVAGTPVTFTNLAAHSSSGASPVLYALVLVTGSSATLDSIRVGAVPVNPYDEVENNDDPGSANTLPAAPFTGFRGNIGTGDGSQTVYDGDTNDFFSLPTTTAASVQFTLNTDNPLASVTLFVTDNSGVVSDYITVHNSPSASLSIDLTGAQQPLSLQIGAPGTDTANYTLDCKLNPPIPTLTATPPSGSSPLHVVLDASGSIDPAPGHIVSYEFDPENTGTFTAPQSTSALPYDYPAVANGFHRAAVRVTDDEGLASLAYVNIVTDVHYDEVENNDDIGPANLLPVFPFSGFKASFGHSWQSSDYYGYDGDQVDVYKVPASVGQTIHLNLTYTPNAHGQLSMVLYDPVVGQLGMPYNDDPNAGATDPQTNDGHTSLTYTIGGHQETGPIYMAVVDANTPYVNWIYYGDYTISGTVN